MDYLDFILRNEGKDGNLTEIIFLELHKIMFLIFKHNLYYKFNLFIYFI